MNDWLEWSALYRDGTAVGEIGPNGEERPWAVVRPDAVQVVSLWPKGHGPHYAVDVGEGDRAFFTRRRLIRIADGEQRCLHIIGTERDNGTGAYLLVYPNGSTKLTTNKDSV